LAAYDFKIIYKPGTHNSDADAMSRLPKISRNEGVTEIASEVIKAICHSSTYQGPLIQSMPVIDIMEATEIPGTLTSQIEVREIRKAQREDEIVSVWVTATKEKRKPKFKDIVEVKKHSTMNKNFPYFKLIRGVLYREVTEKEETKLQLVIPTVYRSHVLKGCHDNIGHPGRERTLAIMKERFWWPQMSAQVEEKIKMCDRCIRRKSPTNSKAPLVNITSTYPLELVCMDFLKLDTCKGGYTNVLVIVDHFTRFAQAFPTKNQTAKTTAEIFFHNFVLKYGFPTKLLTDQGANFESQLMQEVCQKTRTTIYHPMCNGMSERFNRTLIEMLGTLEKEKKHDWKSHIESLVYAYNAIPHESTGVSPFELMFGRKPVLPVDLMFEKETKRAEDVSQFEYINQLKEKMRKTQEIAKQCADRARTKQKSQYDKRARATKLEIGDKVLVKVLAFEGPHKLVDKFEEAVYTVIGIPNTDIPVFEVQSTDGKIKLLHRNHLLPVHIEQEEENTKDSVEDTGKDYIR
jgi:transposase InsO family protein